MKCKKLLGGVMVIALLGSFVDAEEINLNVKNDLILSDDVRSEVVALSEELLSEPESGGLVDFSSMENPFVFEQEPVVAEASGEAVPDEPVISYDDASVLRLVVMNFSQQVSGTLVRGATSFLQLEGGTLVRPGTSFPVTIPQAQNRSFTVTVPEITADSYTLKIGDAEQVVQIGGEPSAGGGATRTN